MKLLLGIDVGATGTKGAIVNPVTGELLSEKIKIKTPDSKKPDDMIAVIKELVETFNWKGKPVGIGFPAIIKNDKAWSASNIHKSWIGYPVRDKISEAISCPVYVINDADAAGIAEMEFGRGKGEKGTVMLLTLGTGIGSALFIDGKLVPNTEFGQLHYRDSVTEHYASNSARKNKDLSWEEFGKELNAVLEYIHFIFSPNLIILGGGISKKMENYSGYISDYINIEPAQNLNNAGIIGAAMAFKRFA